MGERDISCIDFLDIILIFSIILQNILLHQETQGIPNPPCSKKKWSWPQIAASSFVTRRLDPRFSMAIKLMQMIMTVRAPIKRFYSRHNERKQDGNYPNGLRGLIFYRPRPRRPVYISLLVYNKNF